MPSVVPKLIILDNCFNFFGVQNAKKTLMSQLGSSLALDSVHILPLSQARRHLQPGEQVGAGPAATALSH